MEDNVQTPQPIITEASEKPKTKNPYKPATIILAILALAGAGFGVYEYLQNNQAKQQISDLKEEVKQAAATPKPREEGYFYFDEWGIKVKLASGENYKVLGYLYDSKNEIVNNESQGQEYSIWGGSYKEEDSDTAIGFYPRDNMDNSTLYVARYKTEFLPHYTAYGEHHKVWTDDEYTYYAVHPNGMRDLGDSILEEKYTDFWKNAGFLDPDNYSAI